MQFPYTKNYRLRQGSDFKRVMDNPLTKLVTGSLVIFVCVNNQPMPRLGIIVSKRNVRNAVSRNRIKRHIRESFRQHQSLLFGKDIVVIGRKAAEILSSRGQLANILGEQWKKLAAKSF